MRWLAWIPILIASRAALACPTLPEGTDWWIEEIAPACGAHPFHDALALHDVPNLCNGPCPRVCQITHDGVPSTVSYDERGRWTETAPLVNGYAGSSESCTYDEQGHRDRCTRNYSSSLSSSSPTIRRDRAGRVISITNQETIRFVYDRRGRLTDAITPTVRWEYRYDARGRIAREEETTRTPRRTYVTTYRYNRRGQLVARTSLDEKTTFAYADGRLVEQTSTTGLRRLNGPETHVVQVTYDAQGRPLTAGDLEFGYCD